MKIVAVLKSAAKKSTRLRILMRETFYIIKKIRYKCRGFFAKVDEKIIVFGAYNGRNYACSPKAIYEYILQDEKFEDYQFVWIFNHPKEYQFLEKKRNTIIVKNQSVECERYLQKAKYWIFNFRAVDQWVPKKNQIYVQCWHGTPLKRLGYDITNSDNAMNSVLEIQNKYKTDTKRFKYLLSSCRFVTEKFTTAWNLKQFHKENAILEVGYPRNDFLSTFSSDDVAAIKKRLGLEKCAKKIILYAPTWRDNQHDAEAGYVYESPVDFEYLYRKLSNEYVILFRAHYLVADNFDFDAYQGFLYDASSYDDINDLYIAADMLITDYSSVFFDYAITEKKMIFYMYDMEEYRDEVRGFYLDVDELPGKIVQNERDLINEIKAPHSIETLQDIKSFNLEYNKMNDGQATMRLVETIFR